MNFRFTEENLGKGYELLEVLAAQSIAHQLALTALMQHVPHAKGHIQALAGNVTELLLPMQISDQAILLVKQRLEEMTNPPQ